MALESPAHGPVSPLEIGPLRIWSPVVLAPMAGVTDAPFRRLCRELGEKGLPPRLAPGDPACEREPTPGVDALAGLYVMEMVTSRALVEGNRRTLDMVRPDPSERVRSIQLYGVDPATMAKATEILIDCELVDHLDLNFGCPVPKVTRKGGGSCPAVEEGPLRRSPSRGRRCRRKGGEQDWQRRARDRENAHRH